MIAERELVGLSGHSSGRVFRSATTRIPDLCNRSGPTIATFSTNSTVLFRRLCGGVGLTARRRVVSLDDLSILLSEPIAVRSSNQSGIAVRPI